MPVDGKVIIGTQVDESGLNKGIGSVTNTLAGLKKTIIGLGIGTAVVSTVKEMVTSLAEFEGGLAKASTLFGDVQVDMDNLEKRMFSLSSASGVATSQLNEGLYQALSAGVPVTEDMAEATEFLEQATKLSVAGFTDLPTAIEATAKTLNAYGLATSEAERIQNILITTQNRGITTVDELGGALANVTPIAASFGVSFEQVGASLALLTAQGVPTAQATTQLRSIIAELGKDGTQAAKALAESAQSAGWAETSFSDMMKSGKDLGDIIGIMSEYAEDAGISVLDLFSSVEAGQAALSIASDLEKFSDNLDAMANSAGAVEGAYATMDDTVQRSLEKISTSFKNLVTQISLSSDNVITDILSFVNEAISGISEAIGEGGLMGAITYMVNSLDTLLPTIFNWGLTALENLANSMIQNIPVVAGLLFDAVGSLFSSVFDQRERLFNLGVGVIESLGDGIDSVFSIFANYVGQVFGVITTIWDNIEWKNLGIDLINNIWEGIKATFFWFGEKLEQFGQWILDKLTFWKSGKEAGADMMEGYFEGMEDTSINSVDDLLNALSFGFDAMVENAKEKGKDSASAYSEGLAEVDLARMVESELTTPVVEGVELTKLAVGGMADDITTAMEGAADATEQVQQVSQETMSVYNQMALSFLDVWGDAFEAIAKGESAWDIFAKAGLNAIAQIVEALGQKLAIDAIEKFVAMDYAGGALASAGSLAAYAAAGLIKGWAGAFATGGIVQGPYTGGDNLTASVKAGEVILNHAQAINTARMLEAMERNNTTGGGIVIQFQGDVYGDPEYIATMVYNKTKMLQNEGRLARW